ncbi:H-NS histone family protein [Paracidovorax citrulli]|uniref:H-NS histone family protein n=1 Tax=Paracidovorax citrulli TaxID=80869 RepID=UPI0009E244A2|nr:H-NS histone family protein [Paracidovorax citrulli]
MADTSEAQLAKLEAEHKERMDALKEVETQLAAIRAANRDAKLVELKKQIADYGFTAIDVFGTNATPSKPRKAAKAKTALVVRYRDENGNTWHGGKGPNPKWVKAIKDAGGDIEKYRIAE